MTHSLWYIINLIENEILKRMSHSDPETIEKRVKTFEKRKRKIESKLLSSTKKF